MTHEQLQEIKDRIKHCWNNGPMFSKVAEEDAPALFEEVERLRAALEFYADKDNNKRQLDGIDGEGKAYYFDSEVMRDKGDRARKALEGTE